MAWLFAPCLLGSERLAFRDVGHFYLPLYGLLGERLAADGLPLWNPWDRFGIPVAGETTTAIFYPPRLLFACGIPADYAMVLYVVGHLLIAGSGAYWAAWRALDSRGTRAGRLACVVAAVVYPAAGPVFFLYTNPPFLVGAAWLPWALSGLLRSVHRPTFGTTTIAAVALAMAILGGDPQTAFHAVLFSGGYWATHLVGQVCNLPRLFNGRLQTCPTRQPGPRLLPLLVCVLIASGLSSLQIIPGAAWSLQSWRRVSQPPNLYSQFASPFSSLAGKADTPPSESPETADGAEREADPPRTPQAQPRTMGSRHAADVYDYSVAPWHWAELASPFVAGRLFPVNGRLSQLIPGEPRMWTLTLYAGLLPLLCLLAGPLDPRRWTVWHALVAAGLLLSLGDFGAARLVRSGLEAIGLGMPAGIPDAAGGAYWGLVELIPGYGQFRYPAKWLPFAALGMAVWTAIFLSRSDRRSRSRSGRIAWGVGLLAIAVLAITWLPGFRTAMAARASAGDFADTFWGPLDLSAGLHSLRSSLLITSLFASCYGLLFQAPQDRKWQPRFLTSVASLTFTRRRAVALALAILLADVGLSIAWQLSTVERPLVPNGEPIVSSEPTDSAPPRRFLSMATPRDWPPQWHRTSSANRLEEVEAAERELWFMRWHLADSAAVVNSAVSIASARSTLFWTEARQYALALPPDERRVFVESLHQFLGIQALFDRRLVSQPEADSSYRLHFSPVADPFPLVQWHSDWRWAEAVPERTGEIERISRQLRTLFAEILQTQGESTPRLESSTPPPERFSAIVPRLEATPEDPHLPRVAVVSWQPERVRIHVDAPTAGLVTLQQLQDGFWRARIRPADDATPKERSSQDASSGEWGWRSAEVQRVDVIAQGVLVPSGRHVLEFYYRPIWLFPAMILTALTIAALAICGFRGRAYKN